MFVYICNINFFPELFISKMCTYLIRQYYLLRKHHHSERMQFVTPLVHLSSFACALTREYEARKASLYSPSPSITSIHFGIYSYYHALPKSYINAYSQRLPSFQNSLSNNLMVKYNLGLQVKTQLSIDL